jgi:transcriptional regulator with XRE-family HTH domain
MPLGLSPPKPAPRASARPSGASPFSPSDPTPAELGRRIKLLRIARGLTLKDLEERGGISATHVSEIERGKASPTVGALGRIARALDLRPATLVAPRMLPEVTVLRAAERSARRVQWGLAVLEAVADPIHGAELSAQIMTLPMSREPALSHQHEGEEWVSVLSGVAEIQVGSEAFMLREGDSLHFRAYLPHAYANPASSPAVLVVATRPRLSF